MNKRPPFEYKPHEFSAEEKRFLAAVSWAHADAGDLLDLLPALEAGRPDEIERITYLVGELLRRHIFDQRRHAYAFARSYVALAGAGTDFRLLVWDWE